MTFDAEVSAISSILLIDGTWHVVNGGSFEVVSTRLVKDGITLYEDPDLMYARWKDGHYAYYTCPINQVVALRYDTRAVKPDPKKSK